MKTQFQAQARVLPVFLSVCCVGIASLVYILGVRSPALHAQNQIANRIDAQKDNTLKTQPAPVLFVVDASGSMTELFSGVPRMVAARVMLFEQLQKLDANVPVGLVAYGNRIAGCRSHRIYGRIRLRNRRDLADQVKKLYPAGATPIANTLRMIGTNLLPYHPGTTVVIISDGAESCGGDPVREAQKLIKRGYNVKLNVIGLDVDQITAMQLGAIARVGQGQYFDVKNQVDFANAVSLSTNREPAHTTVTENKPVIVKHDAMLKITKVYPLQDAQGNMNWQVKYEFESQKSGDYLVEVKAISKPVASGPGGQIPNDDRLIDKQIDVFYNSLRGTKEATFNRDKLQKNKQDNRPVYFQAELWNTSSIPVLVYISEPFLAK